MSPLGNLLRRKLGACPKCIRSSAAGMVLSWLVLAAVVVGDAPVLVRGIALVGGVAFTGLFFAHVIAFFVRSSKVWRQLEARDEATVRVAAATAGAGGDRVSRESRRAFFTVTGSALVAMFVGPFVAGSTPAGAQTPDCVGRCIERQYDLLRSCIQSCQTFLHGCVQTQDPRGCLSQFQTCTSRCTASVPFAPVREHCLAACRTTTTSSSSTSSSSTSSSSTSSTSSTTTSTTRFDCDTSPFGCGG